MSKSFQGELVIIAVPVGLLRLKGNKVTVSRVDGEFHFMVNENIEFLFKPSHIVEDHDDPLCSVVPMNEIVEIFEAQLSINGLANQASVITKFLLDNISYVGYFPMVASKCGFTSGDLVYNTALKHTKKTSLPYVTANLKYDGIQGKANVFLSLDKSTTAITELQVKSRARVKLLELRSSILLDYCFNPDLAVMRHLGRIN